MRALALLSGGKDSWYAAHLTLLMGMELRLAVTFIPESKDSYMLHYPALDLVPLQCKLARIPHLSFGVSGVKEKEVEEMISHLRKLVEEHDIEALVCGAVQSEYQKMRVEFIAEELGLVSYAPLWKKDERNLLEEIVRDASFRFIVVRVAAEGLENWIGRIVDNRNFDSFLNDLEKARANPIGEGGEYETLVLYMPLFSEELRIGEFEVIKYGKSTEIRMKSMN